MRDESLCWRAALAAVVIGCLAATPAWAAEPDPATATQLINEIRQRVAGCGAARAATVSADAPIVASRPTLAWNEQLANAAETHSRAMAEQSFFDHTGPDGSRVAQRASASGYRWRSVGENLAAGHRTLADALNGWLRSEGHCRNLLDERFSDFGLARVVSTNPNDRFRVYWTLVLGRPFASIAKTASLD